MNKLYKNFSSKKDTVEAMLCLCTASCQCPTSCPCIDITNLAALDNNILLDGVDERNHDSVGESNAVWG